MSRGVSVIILLATVGGVVLLWRTESQNNKTSRPISSRQSTLEIGRYQPADFSPLIRVNVTPRRGDPLQIAIDGTYVVRPVGSADVLARGKSLDKTTVTATSSGLRIGGRRFPVSRLEIVGDQSPSVWVGKHQYRGTLRLFRRAGNSVVAVNVLPLEEYTASVVDSEMPATFPKAARQAQAVIARTYALYQMQVSAKHPYFDVHASTQSQKYLGFQYHDQNGRRLAGESKNSREIVQETQGMVCTFRGQVFCTYYSAVCGGRTTPGKQIFSDAAPPLQSVSCQWCRDAKRYRWRVEFPKSDVDQRLHQYLLADGRPFDSLQSVVSVGDALETGVTVFEISDGRNRYRFSGKELRQILPSSKIPSPRFRIRETSERLILEGQGHGHGVGLCQWGARGQALAGRNALQILQYYYPGSRVVVMEPN